MFHRPIYLFVMQETDEKKRDIQNITLHNRRQVFSPFAFTPVGTIRPALFLPNAKRTLAYSASRILLQLYRPMPIDEEELYQEHILDHYEDPFHRGHLPTATHAHEDNNPLCGDVVRIELRAR